MAKNLHPKIKTDSLAELYRDGKTLEEIGNQFGISRQAVQSRLKRAGIDRQQRGRKTESLELNRDVLIELYQNRKLSTTKVAEELNSTVPFVIRQLKKHKIQLRTRKEARRLNCGRIPQREELERLYLTENKTQAEIAEIYQIGQQAVSKWLKRYDLKKELKPRSLKKRERRNR
ncbi:MAG: helix-turn-helix domain-containing protein [Acidobacteriota bacterium]|nr:helix-turn-helix domain-containing protein [Acidobacteriota bacterium]